MESAVAPRAGYSSVVFISRVVHFAKAKIRMRQDWGPNPQVATET